MVCSRTTAIVNRRLDRLGDEGPQSYRIRAKTLNHNQDSALQRFLQAQRIDVQQTYERIFNEENYSRIREWEKLKQTLPKSSRKESFKRFIFEEELEAYRKLRRENKAVKLLEAVFKGITLHHRIHPSLGECVFFEFILHNSYPEPINCIIEIDEPALSVVTDKDTWEFFKRVNQIATPIEKNLFNITNQENGEPKIEVFLKPNEHLHIPFLYDDLKYVQKEEGAVQDTKVIFRRWDNQDVISILALTIEHRPYCLDASYRFFWHRETNFERTVAVENLKQRVGAVRCTDPTVKVHIRNVGVEQQLSLSSYCGLPGTLRTFLVLLYGDRYRSRLLATWRFTVHSAERVDIRSTMGQMFKHQLTMSKPDGAALIELFSSSPAIQCLTPKPILTDSKSNAPGTISIGYEPHTTNSDVSLISAIDASTQTLLTTWIIYSTAEMPNVTKQFEIRIPIEHEDNVITKQLSISNRYSIPRSFRLNISKPQLVQVNPTELKNIQPGISVPISLYFPNVVRKPMSVEVLLYILQMDTGTEEETFSMLLTYF